MNAIVVRKPDDEPGDFKNLRSLMEVISTISPRSYDQNMPINNPDPRRPMCAAGHAYRLGLVTSVSDEHVLGRYFDLPPRVADGLFGPRSNINRILNRPTWFPVKPHHWIKAAAKIIEEQRFVRQRFS